MLIDAHSHLWMTRMEETKRQVLGLCERYHVDRTFLSTLNGYYPDEEEIRTCNDMTRDFMREYPKLIGGMAYLNPAHANCMDELRRRMEEEGFHGIKLWVATLCDDERVHPIAEYAVKHDIPLLAHTFKKATNQLEHESLGCHAANLARRYPELKLIAAHIGANVYDTVKSIKDYPNIYVDFSGSYYRRDCIDYTVRHLGVGRILFGSDMPGVFEDCIGKVEGADLTAAERHQIYAGNACKLFNLEKGS